MKLKNIKPRKHKRKFINLPLYIKYEISSLKKAKIIKGKTIDMSDNGLGVVTKEELPPKTVTVIVKSEYKEITFDAKIIWSEYIKKKGEHFAGAKIENLDSKTRQIINKLLEEKEEIEIKLDIDFVDVVNRIKKYMKSVEELCKNHDLQNPTRIEKIDFVNKNSKEIFSNINEYFYKLDNIIKEFNLKEYKMHQKYIQKELMHFFFRGKDTPMNTHVLKKPLGYAGDYITMNYIYNNQFIGNTTYGLLIGKHALDLPIAKAHRNREKILQSYIDKIVNHKKHNTHKNITSFACGPAVEIVNYINKRKNMNKLSFFCIDAEERALDEVSKRVKVKKSKYSSSINLNLYKRNIINILKKGKIEQFPKQDLIYSSGFMDYLTDIIAIKYIRLLIKYLKPNGRLILVNISSENPVRSYLEMVAEWYLHHRSKKNLGVLAQKACPSKRFYIEEDPETKMNLYLVIDNE